MNQYDSYGGGGHMERALPGLTRGVKLLLLLNLIGFVVKNMIFGSPENQAMVSQFVGFSWTGIGDGYGLGLLRLISYQFFHGIGLGHIVFNMIFLYFFGTLAEGGSGEGYSGSHLWLGRYGIVKLYLVSGVVGGIVYALMSLTFGGTGIPVIGASGSVFGIMVFAAAMNPGYIVRMIFISIEIRYLVGFFVFGGIYYTYVTFRGGTPDGTAHSAHLGGALWGFIGFKLAKRGFSFSEAGPVAWFRRKREENTVKSAQNEQDVLNQILDKVHRQGMSALTPAERRFLERVSKKTRK